MEFAHDWMGPIFAGIGLVLIILEMAGLEMEFDLIIIGSAFAIGGLITWPFQNWYATIAVVCVLLVAYVAVGRAYIHRRWLAHKEEKTNIDTIVGKKGMVHKAITQYDEGQVKVGYEDWRARADEDIPEGEEVEVVEISGVTLTVKKYKGGD
jgi:membrane protein implicated in regulation of membrane protease activity